MEVNEIIKLISNNGLAIVLLVFLMIKGTKFFNDFFKLYHKLDERLDILDASIRELIISIQK